VGFDTGRLAGSLHQEADREEGRSFVDVEPEVGNKVLAEGREAVERTFVPPLRVCLSSRLANC